MGWIRWAGWTGVDEVDNVDWTEVEVEGRGAHRWWGGRGGLKTQRFQIFWSLDIPLTPREWFCEEYFFLSMSTRASGCDVSVKVFTGNLAKWPIGDNRTHTSCSILSQSIYLTKFGFLKSLCFGNWENAQKYIPLQLWTSSILFLTF